MQQHIKYILFLSTVLIGLSACNIYRYVPENDKLYTGSTIKIIDSTKKHGNLKSELKTLLKPAPNKKFLGLRVKLGFYSISKPTQKKGLNHLLHNKLGEPPVLLSKVKPELLSKTMMQYLRNKGYFNDTVYYKIITKKRKASLEFTAEPNEQYFIQEVSFPKDSSPVSKAIANTASRTLLKAGDPYDLQTIIAERIRISDNLQNRGYYYFLPDFLLIEVDSTLKGKVNLYVKLKNNTPGEVKRLYRIGEVKIFPNYSIEKKEELLASTGVVYDTLFTIIDSATTFHARTFKENVLIKPGKPYQRRTHETTLRRLSNLSTFKFLNLNFIPSEKDSSGKTLDAHLFLTPMKRRSLQLEITGTTKSNNFVGSGVKLKMLNRNVFKNAEQLEFNVGGGFEKQVGGVQVSTNAYSFTTDFNLLVPRIYAPFKVKPPKTNDIPRTKFSGGLELLSRSDLYTLQSLRFSFGYVWKNKRFWQHSFNPIYLNSIQPSNITNKFDSILKSDLTLRNSFEKQLILGSSYTVTFNNQGNRKKSQLNISGTAELAGNLAGLLFRKKNTEGQKTVLGNPYSQYISISTDARHYLTITPKIIFANRLFTGFGFSYGNYTTMPFVKQYFTGGSNSIRSFRNGTLGPGTFHNDTASLFASQTGDIKIEANSELRIKLLSFLQTALFIDAGNVWLLREDANKPGSGFKGKFLNDFAVGGGVGLRLDASILIVRFDFAIPLRIPYLPDGERWVINKIDIGSKDWRKKNLILNIAIGYPF